MTYDEESLILFAKALIQDNEDGIDLTIRPNDILSLQTTVMLSPVHATASSKDELIKLDEGNIVLMKNGTYGAVGKLLQGFALVYQVTLKGKQIDQPGCVVKINDLRPTELPQSTGNAKAIYYDHAYRTCME